jgi:hypothetical protein
MVKKILFCLLMKVYERKIYVEWRMLYAWMEREEREGRRRAGENSTRGLFSRDNISRDTIA